MINTVITKPRVSCVTCVNIDGPRGRLRFGRWPVFGVWRPHRPPLSPLDERFRAWRRARAPRAGAWLASSECACHGATRIAESSGGQLGAHPGEEVVISCWSLKISLSRGAGWKGAASIASQLRGKTDEVKPLTLASLAPSRRVGVNDSVPQLHLELSEAATGELNMCFLVSLASRRLSSFTRRSGSGVTAPVVRATASEEAVARASPVARIVSCDRLCKILSLSFGGVPVRCQEGKTLATLSRDGRQALRYRPQVLGSCFC